MRDRWYQKHKSHYTQLKKIESCHSIEEIKQKILHQFDQVGEKERVSSTRLTWILNHTQHQDAFVPRGMLASTHPASAWAYTPWKRNSKLLLVCQTVRRAHRIKRSRCSCSHYQAWAVTDSQVLISSSQSFRDVQFHFDLTLPSPLMDDVVSLAVRATRRYQAKRNLRCHFDVLLRES